MEAHVLGQLPADAQHRVQRRQRDPGRPSRSRGRARRAARACAAPAGRGRRTSRARRPGSVRQQPHAAPAPSSSCRCRSRLRRRRPDPARRRSSTSSTIVTEPLAVGRRTLRRSTSRRALMPACSARRSDDVGSSASRRLSPRKLNASTTVRIARPGNAPIHQSWKYSIALGHASRPTPASAAARRGRGTTGRRAAGSRCRGRAWPAPATGPDTFGSTSRTRALRADEPSRRVAETYSESTQRAARGRARRARTRASYDDHQREHGVARLGPSAAVTTIARMIAGNANTRSACA